MPLGLYSAWLPMRMYGGGGASGVPMLPPQHPSAGYPAHPELHQNRLPQLSASASGHSQGYYPLDGCRRTANQRALSSFTDSEDEDGSIGSPASPAHDLSKSRHGETHSLTFLLNILLYMRKIVNAREIKICRKDFPKQIIIFVGVVVS